MNVAELKLNMMLSYAALGWPTFMLSPSKVPVKLCGSDECEQHRGDPDACEACECLLCHAFYSATTDPDRIQEMVRVNPRGLVAIRTGAASGVVAVDVDIPDGLPTMAELIADGLLPRTVAERTHSGGWHLLYAHPGEFKVSSGAGKVGKGIDAKADGAYIVTAPSVHPRSGRPYRWVTPYDAPLTPLHPELAERLRADREPVRVVSPAVRVRAGNGTYGRLRGLVALVLDAKPRDRNGPLFWAACRAAELVADGQVERTTAEDLLVDAALRAGLRGGEAEARRTVASGLRSGEVRRV